MYPHYLLGPLLRSLTRYVLFQLGIRPAIHGKIRPGNVRGLRTGDKRHQRSDLIDVPVAVECRGGLLRYRPIARGGHVDEVAALVAFVAGPESSYITGANLTVDGGMNA